MPSTNALETTDLLVMQQVTGFLSNDFALEDSEGRVVAHGHTRGSAASRIFGGNRQFEITDLDGTPLFHVHDPMTLGRDRYRVTDPQGGPIADLLQRMTFLRTSVQISVVDGTELVLDGNLRGMDFRLTAGGTAVATVNRKWAGLGQALMGRSRYGLSLDPGMPGLVRYAVIGSVIALDLIRAKQSRRNND
ncbi:LURP-one-related/scramblase family protein [Microbacterium sp. A93]|uniref:LURP-one-related/scramblase family protein n=1 Tax=Microbacterium sp. A93 TaxID=3450716 RepID=UPI003F42B9A9